MELDNDNQVLIWYDKSFQDAVTKAGMPVISLCDVVTISAFRKQIMTSNGLK